MTALIITLLILILGVVLLLFFGMRTIFQRQERQDELNKNIWKYADCVDERLDIIEKEIGKLNGKTYEWKD